MALVCLCYGVSERRIRREIDNGARSVEQVAEQCRAGSCCQSCRPAIDELLAERPVEAVVPAGGRRLVIA